MFAFFTILVTTEGNSNPYNNSIINTIFIVLGCDKFNSQSVFCPSFGDVEIRIPSPCQIISRIDYDNSARFQQKNTFIEIKYPIQNDKFRIQCCVEQGKGYFHFFIFYSCSNRKKPY